MNIMFVGVGGQGSLLASKLLGNLLINKGYDTKVSEVHGMSQRGGSVITYVKYGEKVYSPVIEEGEADIIVAFEQLEAARWVSYLKKDGIMIINTQKILPMPVVTGVAEYPENIIETLNSKGIKIITLDALSVAESCGNGKATNVALMGKLSQVMPFEVQDWMNAITNSVPERFLELNKKVFMLGREK